MAGAFRWLLHPSLQVSRSVMRASLPLPPGDIYNVTVTACTERSRNTSTASIIKLGGPFFFSRCFLRCFNSFRPQPFNVLSLLLLQSRPRPHPCSPSTPRPHP